MGEIAFIHLSDIHFRKSSGNRADIDADLRNAILMDIKYNAKAYLSNVKGILVGGDVAFAGQREEYDIAKEFLKEMASILEIDEKSNFSNSHTYSLFRAAFPANIYLSKSKSAESNVSAFSISD